MDILTFLNQPIVLTLITLVVGSYLFTILSERRARQEKLRDEAIKFITGVGEGLNKVSARVFHHIRTQNIHAFKDKKLNEDQGNLFVSRNSVKIKSRIYLNSEDFWRKYDIIAWHFRFMIRLMKNLTDDYDLQVLLLEIQKYKEDLIKRWPLEDDFQYEEVSKFDPPFQELSSWAHMISDRTDLLLTNSLKQIFNR